MDDVSGGSVSQQDQQPARTAPVAGAPPPEVKIRTMRSDLDMMAQSGGGLPHFQNVKVAGLSPEKIQQRTASAARGPSEPTNAGMVVAIVVFTLIILAIAGFFAYQFFIKK